MNPFNKPPKLLVGIAATVSLVLLLSLGSALAATSSEEAKVTRIVREVKLLPTGAKPKPATLNDQVNNKTGVRTGDRSRSELTFTDLTIERLGANTVFHFNNAGRSVQLDGGSMLLRVPKDSGGGQVQTQAVSVGITGTTLILESSSGGHNKLIMLEGNARLSLRRYPKESVIVRGGQMEDVPAGATKLPPPVNINLNDVMKHHPLITDFPPLPSQDQIYATAQHPPDAGGPGIAIVPPIIGGIIGPPIGIGTAPGGRTRRQPPNRGGNNRTGGDGVSTSSPLKDVANPNSYPGKKKPPPRKRQSVIR